MEQGAWDARSASLPILRPASTAAPLEPAPGRREGADSLVSAGASPGGCQGTGSPCSHPCWEGGDVGQQLLDFLVWCELKIPQSPQEPLGLLAVPWWLCRHGRAQAAPCARCGTGPVAMARQAGTRAKANSSLEAPAVAAAQRCPSPGAALAAAPGSCRAQLGPALWTLAPDKPWGQAGATPRGSRLPRSWEAEPVGGTWRSALRRLPFR